MLKKREYSVINYKNNHTIFKCPICNSNINIIGENIVCELNHTFNISKKGVAVLMKSFKYKEDKVYTKKLFENRKKFIEGHFYDEVHKIISEEIKKYNHNLMLDMGSGDGTHDFNIINMLNDDSFIIGVDFAKDGVDLSSEYFNCNFLSFISDLNYLPFNNNVFDLIINFLSPSNEEEIKRLLKTDGILIKVTPKKEYLKELRNLLNISEYENEKIIDENISKKYNIIKKVEYKNTFKLDELTSKYLFNMTPLTNNYNDDKLKCDLKYITIGLNIYILKVKNERI